MAEAPAETYREVIQLTDVGGTVAEINSTLTDGRYVLASESFFPHSRNEEEQPRAVFQTSYAFDCKPPLRMFTMVTSHDSTPQASSPTWNIYKSKEISSPFKLDQLPFEPIEEFERNLAKTVDVSVPSTLNLLAIYACEVAANPTDSARIAKKLRDTGNISDLKNLTCNVRYADQAQTEATYRLSFSDKRKFVNWRGEWQHGASVDDDQISFKYRNIQTTINRNSGNISAQGQRRQLLSGTCVPASQDNRKF